MSVPPALKPVYLLTGNDRPKIDLALARLRRHFEPEAVERISALDATGPAAVALCNAGSLFGTARLVVVESVDGRPNAEGRLTGGWKAADVDAVTEYLQSPAPGTTLALVAAELKKDATLAKVCAKAGDLLEFSVPKNRSVQWVAERFRQAGVLADQEACAALVHLVGDDVRALASEVDKLVTWAGGDPVGEREVAELVAATADTPSFAITDAWARHDPGAALEASEELFERSDRPRREEAARLSAALGSHAAKLKTAHRLAGDGVRAADALSKLGTRSSFYANKLYQQAERFSEGELRDATEQLAHLDLALKGKSKLTAELELQLTLIELSREPGHGPKP